jgi:hypothetical protein
MKSLSELNEAERLILFEVEELETRLEMWFDSTNGGCGNINNVCPVNPSCYDQSCNANYSC